ncbi:MAG: hypothetical protein J6X84_01450 [Treponema sp.]|nr:hypothetical protein [Treponema sp.]
MKKLLILISTALMAILPLCAEESLFSFSAGISSGFPIYGKDSTISTGSEISNGNRVIIGTTAAINLNPIKHVSFYLGNDLLWDTTWNASEKSQKLHVSFPLGIKIYPGIGGLNCGLAYTLGFRYDNIKTDEAGEHNDSTPWGNGFKIQVEYNFAHEGSSKYLPSIGTYWNLMPRGNNSYDNLIVLYISANF